jgi:arsenite oxidase large subunit
MAKRIYEPQDRVPLPPRDAEVLTTACDYCIVACGYKIYRWPVGKEGGLKAHQNALGIDYPVAPMSGKWISPSMHNIASVNGRPHNVVVIPDGDSKVVNVGGGHSIRGGALAQKVYNPKTPTKDRLLRPLLRVRGGLTPISWDDAMEIMAQVSNHVIDTYGAHAWALKMFSYQFYENTYALTKLALRSVKTPAFAFHDNPGVMPDTPGFRDVGFDNFSASYEDWSLADVLYISGTDPYETKTIIFNEWILKGINTRKMKVIYALPRKTTGVPFAEATGGMHLWLIPGTDTVLHMAIARVILENGWEDREWIGKYTNNKWDTDSGFGQGTRNTQWQWRTTWGNLETKGFEDYKKWILAQEESKLDVAERITGVPRADIVRAAEMMAKPRPDGSRPKTSIGIEKGNYWSNNYLNTASIGSVALLCGAGNRPGQVVSRFGGHQRGGRKGGRYPMEKSPEKYPGRRRKALDLDRWVEAGNVRFSWAVGTTWVGSMTASQALEEAFKRATVDNPHQLRRKDVRHAVEVLKKRVDSGGMMHVFQDIYLRQPLGTTYADIVLPAATWGEDDFTRANGERRIRLYSKFYDAPGESKSDWWIAARFAKKMGFEGFDWKDSNDVFEESARFGRGSRTNYQPLVWVAKKKGMRGHELLRTYGTQGIQAPIRYEDGKLVGTKRLHDTTLKLPADGPQGPTVWPKWLTAFKSQTGKANFMKSPWSFFSDFYDWFKPKGDELWVINGRINEIWQSGFDDMERRPQIMERWPVNFMEIHPEDAKARRIESGDWVTVENNRIPVQVSGYYGVQSNDQTFTEMKKAGHIKMTKAKVDAVAIVTPAVRKGVAWMYFLDPLQPANALVARVTDPLSNNYRYKLGMGRVRRKGASPYKKSLEKMSFARRDIA